MRKRALFFIGATVLLGACSESPNAPSPPSLLEIAGTWELAEYVYTRSDDPTRQVDWVDLRGFSGWLTIAESGEFVFCQLFAGAHGTFSVQGDSLHWVGPGRDQWLHVNVGARALALEWLEEQVTDIDQDGQPESAWLRIVFRRGSKWEVRPGGLWWYSELPPLSVPDTVRVGETFTAQVLTTLPTSCVRVGPNIVRRLSAMTTEVVPLDSFDILPCRWCWQVFGPGRHEVPLAFYRRGWATVQVPGTIAGRDTIVEKAVMVR